MSSVLLLEPIASCLTSTPPRARPAHGHSLDRAAVPVWPTWPELGGAPIYGSIDELLLMRAVRTPLCLLLLAAVPGGLGVR